MARAFFRRRKSCPFSGKAAPTIDYKDVRLLQGFVSERGKIVPSRITAVPAEKRSEAEKAATGVGGKTVQLIRQASNTGQLYGSVSARDIAEALEGVGAK